MLYGESYWDQGKKKRFQSCGRKKPSESRIKYNRERKGIKMYARITPFVASIDSTARLLMGSHPPRWK